MPGADDQVYQIYVGLTGPDRADEDPGDRKGRVAAPETCVTCGSALQSEDGVMVCLACAQQFGGVIETGAEWRYYGSSDSRDTDPDRCGLATNQLLFESSYGTIISSGGHQVLRRLHSWQAMPHYERSLYQLLEKLRRWAQARDLPPALIRYAQVLYSQVRQAQQQAGHLSKGDNLAGLLAAALFYSCQQHQVNRSHTEIAEICGLDPADVSRGCKIFYRLMHRVLEGGGHTTTYLDFLDRFGSHLGFPEDLRAEVRQVADRADQLGLLDHNSPPSIAAGCLMFVAVTQGLNISQDLVRRQCGVSAVTIQKVYRKLMDRVEHLLS